MNANNKGEAMKYGIPYKGSKSKIAEGITKWTEKPEPPEEGD